jgi:hypothetical protein
MCISCACSIFIFTSVNPQLTGRKYPEKGGRSLVAIEAGSDQLEATAEDGPLTLPRAGGEPCRDYYFYMSAFAPVGDFYTSIFRQVRHSYLGIFALTVSVYVFIVNCMCA